MKVKARYGINCDKGQFDTGECFEIDAKDLPMYGDAVEVVGAVPATPAEPEKKPEAEKKAEPEKKPEAVKPAAEEKAEKPKSATRRKKISE